MNRLFLALVLAAAGLLPARLFAQAPTYAGNAFDAVQSASEDATLFFGVIVVIAVLVTGFFLGRKWLKGI